MTLGKTLKTKLLLSNIFFCLFLVLSIIALIGPRWGMGYAPTEFRRGLDIVFAIDVSRSMDIRDAQTGRTAGNSALQTRLERGLLIARDSIASVSGARLAAAIGRGRGYLAVPLTYDNEAAIVFLEAIDGSSMTGRSTNLESLIDAASDAFENTSPARKVIILISDGESHAGILRNAVNRCVKDGIIINTIAVGSDEGRQIPAQADDPHSQSVLSQRDAVVMRGIAERTGGIYIDGSREDAANALASHLLSLSQEIGAGKGKKEPKQRRGLFVILALIAYSVSKFVTRQYNAGGLTLASIVAVITLFSSCEGKLLLLEANYLNSRARYDEAIVPYLKALNHKDAAPYAEYGLGLTFYMLDEGEAAINRYKDSQKMLEGFSNNEHRELRYRNHYNSGIILFEEGHYQSAADAFKEALRTDPRRMDAKRNLELSLLSVSMESKTENRTEEQEEQREILFEYIKQEEQQVWKSREWAPEEKFTGPDY